MSIAFDPLLAALIADAQLDTVDDAIQLIKLLVDQTDPDDKIGGALSMIVWDRDEYKRLMDRAEGKARVVRCVVCNERYDPATPDGIGSGKQGYGCASAIYEKDGEWYVSGTFGSRLFDMQRLRFTGKTLADVTGRVIMQRPDNTGPACDICVQQWLDLGVVKHDAKLGPDGKLRVHESDSAPEK
jgi:hypothetical protein